MIQSDYLAGFTAENGQDVCVKQEINKNGEIIVSWPPSKLHSKFLNIAHPSFHAIFRGPSQLYRPIQ